MARKWRPRQGRKLTVRGSPGWIERTAVEHVGKLPKIFLYGPVALIVAWLLAPTGRGELTLKSVGAVVLALWLAFDLWHWLLHKTWQWRFVAGWTGTGLLFIGSMAMMWWWLNGVLQDQREEVRNKLTAVARVPPSNNPFQSGFTIRNGASIDIEKDHMITCQPHLFVGLDGDALFTVVGKFSEASGSTGMTRIDLLAGNSETDQCLEIMLTPVPPSCMDVTLRIDYSLATQPHIKQDREWRFVAKLDGGWYHWVEQSEGEPGSYCWGTLNAKAKAQYMKDMKPVLEGR